MDSAKELLALFRKYNTDTLGFTDYAVIDGYNKAIRLLENLGYIRVCNDVIASIELIQFSTETAGAAISGGFSDFQKKFAKHIDKLQKIF